MIRTILVDDEQPALAKMKYLLADYPDYEIVGSFSNINDLLPQLDTLKPQIAFLDIAMPVMNGIELAKYLQQNLQDDIKIVFVTAYDQYAVSAFELYATDYLMKPITKARFAQTMERLSAQYIPDQSAEGAAPTLLLRSFGKLEITGGTEPAPTWRTAKTKELFALFLQNRTDGIYRKTLLEIMWEDLPEDKALSNLNTCNYYLRKFLQQSGSDITLLYEGGYYRLDLGNTACDSDIFKAAEEASAAINEHNLTSILYGASLYRGKYLEDVKCTWANLLRIQYDSRCAALRVNISRYYQQQNMLEDSVAQAIMAIETNPLCEDAWILLLQNYKANHDNLHYQKTLENRKLAYNQYAKTEAPELILL